MNPNIVEMRVLALKEESEETTATLKDCSDPPYQLEVKVPKGVWVEEGDTFSVLNPFGVYPQVDWWLL